MNELTGNITFLTIVIISAVIFVVVAVFVMFALLCANVAQIKKALRKSNRRRNFYIKKLERLFYSSSANYYTIFC